MSGPVRWMSVLLDNPRHRAREDELFWAHVTGWPVGDREGRHDEFAALLPVDADPYVWFQDVEGPAAAHPDLYVEDVEDRAARAEQLGAQVTRRDPGLVVLRSPGGLPFCLVTHRDQTRRPDPTPWPGGRSLVDQVCLDIGSSGFDVEADFWAALTGWERSGASGSEFERLAHPDGIPLQVLLQRLEQESGPVRAHVDLACDDRDAETDRHRALGAEVVRRTTGWTTMRDVAGREYCLTRRTPSAGRG